MSRGTTLSYDVAHRTVRSWRQNSFDWFSRWLWNTLRNYMCGVSLVAGRSGGKAYGLRRMERGLWGGGVGKQWTEKESFQQYWHLYVLLLVHYRMTLRTAKSDRDVRTRLTGFRVDLGTRYVIVCVLQEGVGRRFQQYFYDRYKIVVYTGLRSDCIKNHASRYRHRWR
jgi:hypothetical protein